MPDRRPFRLPLVSGLVIASVLLSACSRSSATTGEDLTTALSRDTAPTIGDLLIEQGGDAADLGERWNEGNRQAAEAAKLKKDGEAAIKKAERQISDAEKTISEAEKARSQGEADIKRAEDLLTRGDGEKSDVLDTYCLRPVELRIADIVCDG